MSGAIAPGNATNALVDNLLASPPSDGFCDAAKRGTN